MTAGSLAGDFGRTARATAQTLLDLGLAHLAASDVHGPRVRDSRLSAVAALGEDATVRWLTREVPAAILAGSSLPARPPRQVGERRRWWQRR